jgi:hypothetical protein
MHSAGSKKIVVDLSKPAPVEFKWWRGLMIAAGFSSIYLRGGAAHTGCSYNITHKIGDAPDSQEQLLF